MDWAGRVVREEENRGWVLYCWLEDGAVFIDLGTCVKENEPSSFCFFVFET